MEENRLIEDVAQALENVRAQCPLIHNITNYVTVNDVANIVLAVGASPIMADDIAEAGDIASIAGALVLNIGTLNARTVESMVEAGKRANQAGVPVVLDPVGAGASALRNETTARLLEEIKLTVLRGNLSEISFIAGEQSNTKGVDAGAADAGNDAVAIAKKVAKQLGCVVGITGQVDVVSDGTRVAKIENGVKMLGKVTGTGCMTSALVGSYCGANRDAFTAAVAGIATMGMAGEIAFEMVLQKEKDHAKDKKAYIVPGTGRFHIGIIDAVSRMDDETVKAWARLYEVGC